MMSNVWSDVMIVSTVAIRSTGRMAGSVTHLKVAQVPAPSIRAARKCASGIVLSEASSRSASSGTVRQAVATTASAIAVSVF
jgi:hypothetical protein